MPGLNVGELGFEEERNGSTSHSLSRKLCPSCPWKVSSRGLNALISKLLNLQSNSFFCFCQARDDFLCRKVKVLAIFFAIFDG